jgi:hypothetical protein
MSDAQKMNADQRIDRLSEEINALKSAGAHLRVAPTDTLSEVKEVRRDLAEQDKLLGKMDSAIFSMRPDDPGLMTRMDRVERSLAMASRVAWPVFATVLGLLVHDLYRFVTHQ